MNKQEQAAFVAAFCDNVASLPEHIVTAFITDYENGDDVSDYSWEYTPIMDALGMWHAGKTYQLQRTRDGKI